MNSTVKIMFDETSKTYVARYIEREGQLGPSVVGDTAINAAYQLGLEMGRNPSLYARPLAEYVD
jgi:bifunctional pyridoxal-dependent enzyme with beta-cystathionase and maltose regulon repressor activities